jgi:hypothetical protein
MIRGGKEKEPTAEEGGAFHASLLVLGAVTGLAIPHEPAAVAQALAGQVAKGKGELRPVPPKTTMDRISGFEADLTPAG